MALLTFSARTYGLTAFPPGEKLKVGFFPSGAGFTTVSAFPQRPVWVEPDATGFVSVDLAPTTELRPEVWYEVRFEWFNWDPQKNEWVTVERSTIDGRLRLPPTGGTLGDLLDADAPPGVLMWGYGPPPPHLKDTFYVDISGMELVAYGPSNGGA